MSRFFRFALTILCTLFFLTNGFNPGSNQSHAAEDTKQKKLPAFATVGDFVIEGQTFINTLQQAMREKFYHGKIPAELRAKFQREIGDKMVNRVLYLKEAERRGIKHDSASVQQKLDGYEKRYEKSKRWQETKHKLLPPLVKELETRSRLKVFEQTVRAVKKQSDADILAFYKNNPELFTEPMDQKVSLILLKVDPSAGGDVWDEAKEEAEILVKKLRKGADFIEMARIHSGDPSAANGGRMKYTHKGMLGEEAEAALDKIKPGEITDAVVVLEGVAIFRLEDRTMPTLAPFEEVKKRAEQLLVRKVSNDAWENLTTRLRKETPFKINEEYYLPLSKEGESGEGGHPEAPAPMGNHKK